jgi:glycerol kinase
MPLPSLYADGGASRNDVLMQFQADILGCSVIRSSQADISAVGAAWLAGLAVRYWQSREELRSLPRPVTRFDPAMSEDRRTQLTTGWSDALTRAKTEFTRSRTTFTG